MQSTSSQMLGWKKHKLESRLLGEMSISSDMQMTPPLWQKAKRNKRASSEDERGEWKSWLETWHLKNYMASGPTTLCQIDKETMETVTDFILGGSKITADGDCSLEIKRCLLLERKPMTDLDSILKNRDITNKGLCSQSFGFCSSCVWMWELDHKESWALKN